MTKTLTNTAETLYYSNSEIDKVIYANTYTYTLSSNSSDMPPAIVTNLNQFARPIGIYSVDNGTTWYDIGGNPPVSSINPPLGNSYPSVTIYVDGNGTVTTSMTAPSYPTTFIVKFVLLAVDSPTVMPTPVAVKSSNPYSYTSNLGGTYRQIDQAISVTPISTGYYQKIPLKNPGKIPIVQFWYYYNNQDFNHGLDFTDDWLTQPEPTGSTSLLFDENNLYWFMPYNFYPNELLIRVYKQ